MKPAATNLTRHSPDWSGWSLTPEGISDPEFPRNYRPYTGWLNLNFSLANRAPDHLERVHLGIGVTGAEEVQDLTHELIGTSEAIGGDTQLPNELTPSLVSGALASGVTNRIGRPMPTWR